MGNQSFEVYTDGACSNNQASGMQPGGWGVVFTDGRSFSGGEKQTTNNRMELTAVIEALKNTPPGSQVTVYSDSAYVINAFNQKWIQNWLKNGWKTSQGKSVENQDLWKTLLPLVEERTVKWVKVKGHSGNRFNELADQLAVKAIAKQEIKEEEMTVKITLSKSNYDLLMDKLGQLGKRDPSIRILLHELKRQG
ncbi:ribonuclease HI [Tepidibacillus sp. LV47]|uniref:ribonuclease HI n=1 Tax=Tepidibacillus sp. LV47 TaxID=3398228 RepID=UPI003AAEA845